MKIKQKKETKNKFPKTCNHSFKLHFVNSRAINERLNKQKFEKWYTNAHRCPVTAHQGNFVLWRAIYRTSQLKSDVWAGKITRRFWSCLI